MADEPQIIIFFIKKYKKKKYMPMHLYAAFIQNLYIFAEVKEGNTKRETPNLSPQPIHDQNPLQ